MLTGVKVVIKDLRNKNCLLIFYKRDFLTYLAGHCGFVSSVGVGSASPRNHVACHVEQSRIIQLSELKPNLFELFKRAYEKSQIVDISTSNLVFYRSF